VRTIAQLGALIVRDIDRPGPFRYGYVGPVTAGHFTTFCQLAWAWMRAAPAGVLVVEELADVTTPGKAPAGWGEIARKHRHANGRVYALTQRPAESDKTIVGCAAVLHTGFMNTARDRKYMADCLDIPLAEVTNLARLHWVERNMRTRELTRGAVTFR
jgi:hypothetical protein